MTGLIGARLTRSAALVAIITLGAVAAHAQSASPAAEVVQKVPDAIKVSGKLRIAMPDQGKPFAYKEGSELKGMDVELAKAVAETMGLKPELTLVPFASALTGLQANKFDVSFGEFYITEERMKVADFVTSWATFATFVVKKDSGIKLEKLSDACGKTVAGMTGSVDLAVLEKTKSDCKDKPMKVEAFPSNSTAMLALVSGRIDAVRADRGVADGMMKENQNISVTGRLGGGDCAIAIARTKNSDTMLAATRAAVNHLIATGDYARILAANNTSYGAIKKSEIFTKGDVLPVYDQN
jgi:polar amino acid transport system substrate-binding protein